MSSDERLRLEGTEIVPVKVEGPPDVFSCTRFTLVKARWVEDHEASVCPLCLKGFNQLRRKHHCRQCGRVLCSKCCFEKVPLPQLGLHDPERICEYCRPVAELVTKAHSTKQEFLLSSAEGLSQMVQQPNQMKALLELGGLHTLIHLAKQDSPPTMRAVMSGLHTLSTHTPLHPLLVESGAIKAVCSILSSAANDDQIVIDGITSLMIFVKSAEFKMQALKDGALQPVLSLCNQSDAVALLAVSTLSLIVEHPATHAAIIENNQNALPRILALTASDDEQMQEVSLKTLAHLSMGTDWHRQRIIQEDFTSGKSLIKALNSRHRNLQVLCNATCLVANLATSEQNQSALQELMDCVSQMLAMYHEHFDLMCHLSRAIANFAQFRQNTDRLLPVLPQVIKYCLKSNHDLLRYQGMRAILHLMNYSTKQTVADLLNYGAAEMFECLADVPGVMDSIQSTILQNTPERVRPM